MCCVGWFFKFKWMEQKILIVETVNELQSAYCLQWYFLELILWFPSHNTPVLSSQAATCAHTPQRNTQSLAAQESTRARWHEHDHLSIYTSFFLLDCIKKSFWRLGAEWHFLLCCYLRWMVSYAIKSYVYRCIQYLQYKVHIQRWVWGRSRTISGPPCLGLAFWRW